MNTRLRTPLAAGLFLGGLALAAPAAAQISTAGILLLQQGVDGVADSRSADDFFGSAVAWGDFDGDGFADLAVGVPEEDLDQVDDGVVQVLYGGSGGLGTAGQQLLKRGAIPGAGLGFDGDRMGHALTAGDFDGDGFDDLAVGIPGDEVNGRELAGSVLVVYGSASGLMLLEGAQLWHQDVPGVDGGTEDGDLFGSTLTAGDFGGSGFDDLAIGVPGEDIGDTVGAGAVAVLVGSLGGLSAEHDLFIERGAFEGSPPALDDQFGAALASGDLDGDGFVDLAIGAPGVDLAEFEAAGEVFVLAGGSGGLDPSSPGRRFSFGRGFVLCRPLGTVDGVAAGDRFGSALAIADFDGDGDGELAVGIPGAAIGGAAGAGQVDVIYPGTIVFGDDADCWNQGVSGVGGGLVFPDEHFGSSLAAGDLTGDGVADLVVGVPGERLPLGALKFGGFHAFHGRPFDGLASASPPFWTQNAAGVPNGIETADAFAFALALGDANGDGHADLAVGVPGEEIDNSEPNHGAIQVFYNGPRIFADGFETGDPTAWSSTMPVVSPLSGVRPAPNGRAFGSESGGGSARGEQP